MGCSSIRLKRERPSPVESGATAGPYGGAAQDGGLSGMVAGL